MSVDFRVGQGLPAAGSPRVRRPRLPLGRRRPAPPRGADAIEALVKSERQIIQIRWIGIAVGLLAGPLLMRHGQLLALWGVCLCAAAYNLGLGLFVVPRRPWLLRRGYLSLLADIALADAVIVFTGGLHSGLYLAYFLIAVCSAVRFGGRAALIATAAVMVSYLIIVAATGAPLNAATGGQVLLRTGFLAATALFVGFVADRARSAERQLQQTYDATLAALSAALDQRDTTTEGHSRRVAAYAGLLGRQAGLGATELAALARGALLHDIGKIGVPDDILRKPGALTPAERAVVRGHPALGARILAGVPFLHDALSVVLHHHEQWNGSGYPDGQRAGEIALLPRIFAIVDTYDAIRCDRPYRAGLGHAAAVAEIRRCAGIQFDPDLVRLFASIPEEAWARAAEGNPHPG